MKAIKDVQTSRQLEFRVQNRLLNLKDHKNRLLNLKDHNLYVPMSKYYIHINYLANTRQLE